ncbi:MAG TPA: M50 family metallopeptidase [Anaerovoracaceae bacterium]|nr:M50 family metallopeptidase [Anaerovoracaceae bacterium]
MEESTRDDANRTNIWGLVQERSSFANYRPLRIREAETAVIDTHGGKTIYMLHNPLNSKYISVGEEEFFLWQRMDGQRTIKDLNMEYINEFAKFGQNLVSRFINVLTNAGFLTGKSIPIYEILQGRLLQNKPSSKLKQTLTFFTHSHFNTTKASQYFSWLYQKFGYLLYKKPALVICFNIVVIDLLLSSYYLFIKHETLLLLPSAGSHDVIAFMLISYVSIFIHENAHGLTVKHFGRQVLKGGFLIVYGNPVPYVDTTDILMKSRNPRIAVSFAGPYINGVIGGIFLIASIAVPESIHENLLIHAGLLNSLFFIANLIPIIETDGHYIIQDWFEHPHLRQESLAFVRSDMWKKLIKRERWHRQEFGYLVYGLIAVVGIVYMIYAGIHLWIFTVQHIVYAAIARPFMLVEILSVLIMIILVISIVKYGLLRKKIRIGKILEKHLAMENEGLSE